MTTLSFDATGAARLAHEQHLPALLADKVATRIFAKDATLWGPDAEAEASVRLGWVEAATVSRVWSRTSWPSVTPCAPTASAGLSCAAWADPRWPPRSSPGPPASS